MMENTNEMTIIFDSRPVNEALARVAVASFCTQLNPTLEEISDLKTAVSEAVTNCIIHGYEGEIHKIRVECRLRGQELQVDVTDHGAGIPDIKKAMEPLFTTKADKDRSGMGFTFMEAFMDELEVRSHPGWGDGSGDETENRCASGNVRAGSEVIGVRMHGTYACPDRKGTRRG